MAHIYTTKTLQDLLAEALPKDVPFTFYHYSTPPSKSSAVFNAPPHRVPERTFCESHLLAVSVKPRGQAAAEADDELLILGIEVLVYTTKQLTTIFVSKADSTGYIATLGLPRSQAGSPLKAICGTFISWLARERQREGKKVVVSLFARAQDQYLFPASINNPDKHVLDDRGLVKWWCKVLDPIIREYGVEEEQRRFAERLTDGMAGTAPSEPADLKSDETCITSDKTAKGYLVIPGYEANDTLRYIPPPPSPTAPRRWATTHPLREIAPHPGAPPRCLVPHFPDDPKSRFLDELDDELRDARTDDMTQPGGTPSRSNGQWKSVKTLEQFWETMAFRQECSSGRIVGFIWVVISPPSMSIPEEDEEAEPSQSQQARNESQGSIAPMSPPKRDSPRKPRRRKVNLTGPIPLVLPRIKPSTSNLSTASTGSNSGVSKLPSESTPYFKWPPSSRGEVLLSATAYDRAHEIIVQQNFGTRTAAARSTKRWKDEIAVLGGTDKWGWTITGKKEARESTVPGTANGTATVTLVGTRKKRKADASDAPESTERAESCVHVLGEGLVRKKAKVEVEQSSAGASAGQENVVNTLGAGLVRRKPKS